MKSKKEQNDWNLRLSAWFDGEVSDLDAAEVRQHLLDEPEARARLTDWRSLRGDLQLLQPQEQPDALTLQRMTRRFENGLAHEVYTLSRGLEIWKMAAGLLLLAGSVWLTAERFLTPEIAHASQPAEVERRYDELSNSLLHGSEDWATPADAQPFDLMERADQADKSEADAQ